LSASEYVCHRIEVLTNLPHRNPDTFHLVREQILARRSIRQFRDEPVPLELVDELLLLAGRAPSAHNRQPWRWVVLHTAEAKQRLAEAMGHEFRRDLLRDGLDEQKVAAMVARSHERIQGAPVVLIPCLTMGEMDCYSDSARQRCEWQMAVQSVALACGTLMLAAHARGLGSCWVCAPIFCVPTVQQALALPKAWEPQGLITLGWPADQGRDREKKSVAEITLYR
jgi:coenzyme F420-0:L-glutamate ligase / coenzyme F420-1:gamma-L-glutamate ligase